MQVSSVRILGILLLLGMGMHHLLSAQELSELYDLYAHKNFNELRQRLQDLPPAAEARPEFDFFKALFLEDGDEACKVYERLYGNAAGNLRNLLAEKLNQYYYARGFYNRAADFADLARMPEVSTGSASEHPSRTDRAGQQSSSKKVNYVIQVGAFAQEENARQLKQTLHTKDITARVVTRLINARNLFCVWVDGGSTLDETLQIADTIRKNFQLNYRILEN